MEHEHSKQAIARRLAGAPSSSYLRDWVYGGIDGAVTFAIVAGVIGAQLSNRVVLILGVANLVADGFSMAASNYSGTKTEHEEQAQLRAIEERHIEAVPEGEREEIRQIFRGKGFRGRDLGGRSTSSPRITIAGSTPCSPKSTACPRRCARRSRRQPAPSPPSCCAAPCRCPVPGRRAGSLLALGRHDRARILPDRLDQEPLVAGQLVALGQRDHGDRARRRGAGVRHRLRSEALV